MLCHLCSEDIEDVNAREERILVLYFLNWNTEVSDWICNSRQSIVLSLVLTMLILSGLSTRMIHEWFTHDSVRHFITIIRYFFLTVGNFLRKKVENNQISHLFKSAV